MQPPTEEPLTPNPEIQRERRIRALVDTVDVLPTIPEVANQVGELVHDPRADAKQIAEVMKGDPALTAKVLQVVNSPYFAIPGGVSDVSKAISFLGFNTIHQLVLTVSVFDLLGTAKKEAEALFRHSLAAGGAAEAIAQIIGHPQPAELFTAGLLHDLGRLALIQLKSDLEPESSHSSLGRRLAGKWRFPESLKVAITHHHDVEMRARRRVPRELQSVIDVTVLADAITKRMGYAPNDGPKPELPEEVLSRLNLSANIEVKAHDKLRWNMEHSELLMGILAA